MRYVEACQEGEWSIATWKKDSGEDPRVKPYTCRSWRHEGACRAYCGACDFARCLHALNEHSHWTYLVLTYPHNDWPGAKGLRALFRWGVVHWSRLRKRLVREFSDLLYIQTWEIHPTSGYPHINLVISNPKLHEAATVNHVALRKLVLTPMCRATGFGFCKWAEPLKDSERMAGYITKLGLELTGSHHKNQTPVNAPKHFRRIRASRGLLPKRFKDDTITGQLFKLAFGEVNKQLNG